MLSAVEFNFFTLFWGVILWSCSCLANLLSYSAKENEHSKEDSIEL